VETPIIIQESSQLAQARREALALASSIGLSETLAGRVALISTEIGTNILKYGGGGEMIMRTFADDDADGIEILALDRGPGIADISQSSRDGQSSSGTLGFGMGAIARLSTLSDIYSTPSGGTAVFSRVARARPSGATYSPAKRLLVSGISIAKPGQEACGDTWAEKRIDGARWVTVIDGLGHGPMAAVASAAAVQAFHATPADASPADLIRAAHTHLKGTRGAVMAVAAIRPALGTIEFAGVGNITAVLMHDGETKRLGSSDGTVGYSLRTVRDQSLTWYRDSTLILTSDGLSTRWNLNDHPWLVTRHPSLISAVLYRDFSRNNDDATAVVVKDT